MNCVVGLGYSMFNTAQTSIHVLAVYLACSMVVGVVRGLFYKQLTIRGLTHSQLVGLDCFSLHFNYCIYWIIIAL